MITKLIIQLVFDQIIAEYMDSHLRLSSFERYVSSLQTCEPVNPINILHVKNRDQYLAQDLYSLQEQQLSKIEEPQNASQEQEKTNFKKQNKKEIKKHGSKSPKEVLSKTRVNDKGPGKKNRDSSRPKKQQFILNALRVECHGILKSPLSERIFSPSTESKKVRFRLFTYSSHRQKKNEI